MRSAARAGRSRPARASGRLVARASIAALLLATACGGRADADRDEIKALVAREVAAVNARDMQSLAQIWSPEEDILLFDVAPPGRFQGWTAIAGSFDHFFQRLTDVAMGVENLTVRVDGGLAAATYDWTLAGTLDGQALADRGQATALYRRGKDGWRLVHEHFSAAPRGAHGGAGAAGAGKTAAPAPDGKPVADGKPTSDGKPAAASPPGG